MKIDVQRTGGFTLPGEAGHEELTLRLAKTWGADVIRDSDGTELSPEILEAGYDIYSTICIIREHNDWARQHPDCSEIRPVFQLSVPGPADIWPHIEQLDFPRFVKETQLAWLDRLYLQQFRLQHMIHLSFQRVDPKELLTIRQQFPVCFQFVTVYFHPGFQ